MNTITKETRQFNAMSLTERETQVMNLIVDGFTSEEIAYILFLKESTIEDLRKNILRKAYNMHILDSTKMN